MEESFQVERSEVGRRLGHDLFRYGRIDSSNDWPLFITEGFGDALARGIVRVSPNRFIKKWLQLRLSAYSRNRLFDENVTPDLLMKIDVAECPIMRIQLTHGELTASDWSVDRLNNNGAYALHNLAVMSTLANRAKGNKTFDEVYSLSQRSTQTDGLTPVQWLRLASVMLGPCFTESPKDAPTIPLVSPIPLHTTRFSTQVVQQLFTLMAKQSSSRNLLIKHLKRACRSEISRMRFVCLADAVHFGMKNLEYPWDVWLSSHVMQALIDWNSSLDAAGQTMIIGIVQDFAQVKQCNVSELRVWNLAGGGYRS